MVVLQGRSAPAISQAYLFSIVSLLFGLPLLTAYYNVDSSFYFEALLPYLVVTVVLTAIILVRPVRWRNEAPPGGEASRTFLDRVNSLPVLVTMGVATAAVVSFGVLRFLVFSAFPYPPPQVASDVANVYLVLLVAATILGVSRVVFWAFPVLRSVLRERGYGVMVVVLSVAFAFVYLLLVNQVLVEGFNVAANVPPPTNTYPYAYTFTVGVEQPVLNIIYIPYALVQLSPQVNLLIIPFEIVFAVALAILVSSNVAMSHFLISRSGLRCSTPGAAASALGSVLGLTATCPTCLVPTFISVVFGGITAAEAIYSNVYGAVLPPVLSLLTLLLSMLYLDREIRKRRLLPAEGTL